MKKEELEKLKESATLNSPIYNFNEVLKLIESYERSLKLVKACEMTLSHALALGYLGEGSTMGMALGVVKECEEFLRSIE